MTVAVNQASISWGRGARTAQANVERLADTAANRQTLEREEAAAKLPSAIVKQGQDVLLLSGASLQTASRIARTQGASLNIGDELTVNGASATVLSEDDGFSKVDTQGIIVAVIDTGLDINHPSFKGRIVSPHNAIDGSDNVTDEEGHGTHVAGIIAGAWGQIASTPMVGLCPSRQPGATVDSAPATWLRAFATPPTTERRSST
jgi:subtilisin family serine protease